MTRIPTYKQELYISSNLYLVGGAVVIIISDSGRGNINITQSKSCIMQRECKVHSPLEVQ